MSGHKLEFLQDLDMWVRTSSEPHRTVAPIYIYRQQGAPGRVARTLGLRLVSGRFGGVILAIYAHVCVAPTHNIGMVGQQVI